MGEGVAGLTGSAAAVGIGSAEEAAMGAAGEGQSATATATTGMTEHTATGRKRGRSEGGGDGKDAGGVGGESRGTQQQQGGGKSEKLLPLQHFQQMQQQQGDVLGLGAQGRVAVIADEAHRHHGAGSAEQIHAILAGGGGGVRKRRGGEGDDVVRVQQPRFLSYFGFTATPGPRALQLFGVGKKVRVDVFGEVVGEEEERDGAHGVGVGVGVGVGTEGGRLGWDERAGVVGGAAAVAGGTTQARTAAAGTEAAMVYSNGMPGGSSAGVVRGNRIHAAAAPTAAAAGVDGKDETPGEVALLYSPFHAYTLHQAIADGHVLDVLQRFVSVTPRLHISGIRLQQEEHHGSDEDHHQHQQQQQEVAGSGGSGHPGVTPGHRVSLAEELLVEAASSCRQLVAAKAGLVVERFLEAWREAVEGSGFKEFRGMVVCRSRQHVVWYCQEIRRVMRQQHAAQLQELLEMSGEGGSDSYKIYKQFYIIHYTEHVHLNAYDFFTLCCMIAYYVYVMRAVGCQGKWVGLGMERKQIKKETWETWG